MSTLLEIAEVPMRENNSNQLDLAAYKH